MKDTINKNPIKQRMIFFLDSIGSNANKFAEKFIALGILGDNTKNYLHSKSGIQSDMLAKISENYPQLSMNWLLTGNGSMLLSEEKENLTKKKSNLSQHNKNEQRLLLSNDVQKMLNQKFDAMTDELGKIIMETMSGIVQRQINLLEVQITTQTKTIDSQNVVINNVLETVMGIERKAGKIIELAQRKQA